MSKELTTTIGGGVAPFDLRKPPELPAPIKDMEGLKDPSELVSLTQQMLGSSDTTEFDLLRYRVPGSAGTSWKSEEFGEEVNTKELTGVILATGVRRAFYSEGFGKSGGGAPPDCSSADGVTGFGVLPVEAIKALGAKAEDGDKARGGKGFNCADCMYAQFGSAVNEDGSPGRGQRCKMVRAIYFLGKDDRVPSVIVLPPTSLGAAKKFLNSFIRAGIPIFGVSVKVSLEKHTGGGFPHSRAVFALGHGKLGKSVIERGSPWFNFLSGLATYVRDQMLPKFEIKVEDITEETEAD